MYATEKIYDDSTRSFVVTKLPTQIFIHIDNFRMFGAKIYIMFLLCPFVANTLQCTFMHIYIYIYMKIASQIFSVCITTIW